MTMKSGVSAIALASALLSQCGPFEPALAQNRPVGGLPAHGTPSAADLIPVQPAGSATLAASTAGDVQNFVLTSLNGFPGVDPTGVNDSTAGIQAAINTGQSLSCNGVYLVSSGLTLEGLANRGQRIVGIGETDQTGSTIAGRCVFRPISTFSGFVFTIDGTEVGQYITGWSFENISLDLVNVSDAATNGAFHQIEAYDGHYLNVRVINDGNNKRAWLFSGGAFVTLLNGIQGNIVDMEGTPGGQYVTTLSFWNADVAQVIANYTTSITFNGGAIQFAYVPGVTPVTWVGSGVGPYGIGAAGGGYYLAYRSIIENSSFFQTVGTDWEALNQPPATCIVSGWPYGTYNDGTHGCAKLYMAMLVAPTAFNTEIHPSTFYGMYPYDQGTGSDFSNLSQDGAYSYRVYSAGTQYNLGDIRVTGNIEGPAGFGGALGSETSYTFSISGLTGAAKFPTLTGQPTMDGACIICVKSAIGIQYLDVQTSGTGALDIDNAASVYGFSDTETTQTWQLGTTSGTGRLLLVNPGNAADNITLNAANGNIQAANLYATPVGASGPSTGAFTTLSASTSVSIGGKLQISATAPTYASGFSAGAPTITGSTTAAFTITLGATPGSSGALNMPAASAGWNCMGQDRTTSAALVREAATGSTTVTFTLASTVANDVIQFECLAY